MVESSEVKNSCFAYRPSLPYFGIMGLISPSFLKHGLRTAGFIISLVVSSAAQSLSVGSVAPDFSLRYATRDSVASSPIRLSAILGGKAIVLAFYPADWSGGCTKEVCGFRDDIAALDGLGVDVLAISGDYVYSHHEWAKHHNLPFRLLSDHDHAVAKLYQSFNERTGYNKRTLFVVDRAGILAYVDLEYSVRDDADYRALVAALKLIPSHE